ncbi:hypothetical protein TNCV_2381501 [Trichonephila clavipes]|nr:hypothetical protein TNCV_2381501 [Trichonephila clavipes]
MNKIRKTPTVLNCRTVSPEEFVAIDDDDVCKTQLRQTKTFWSFDKSSKNIDADYDDKNEAPVPTSS